MCGPSHREGQSTLWQIHFYGLGREHTAKVLDDRSMRRAYRGLPEPEHGLAPEHWVTVYVEQVVVGALS